MQFRFHVFLDLWQIDNLRDEDWQGQNVNNRNLPSLVEKLLSVYVREQISSPDLTPSQQMLRILDQAIEKFPNNQYLELYKGRMLIKTQNRNVAEQYYKRLVVNNNSKYFIWNELSELVENTELKLALKCKAVSLNNDSFTGKIRLNTAQILYNQGLLENAKTEIEKVVNVYRQQNWRISQQMQDIANRIPQNITSSDNTELYNTNIQIADNYIYNDLPKAIVIKVSQREVEDRRRQGRMLQRWNLLGENDENYSILPNKFNLRDLPNGTCFEMVTHNNNIVYLNTLENIPNTCQWLKQVNGAIRNRRNRQGNIISFVENY